MSSTERNLITPPTPMAMAHTLQSALRRSRTFGASSEAPEEEHHETERPLEDFLSAGLQLHETGQLSLLRCSWPIGRTVANDSGRWPSSCGTYSSSQVLAMSAKRVCSPRKASL